MDPEPELPRAVDLTRELTVEEWEELGKELYGYSSAEDNPARMDHWEFRCTLCGHDQSVESILANSPYTVTQTGQRRTPARDNIRQWVNKDCVSTIDVNHECNWTRGAIDTYYAYKVHGNINGDVGYTLAFSKDVEQVDEG